MSLYHIVYRWSVRALAISVVLLLCTTTAAAKSPPPGTGASDVPANLLVMLDISGSMSWPRPMRRHNGRWWCPTRLSKTCVSRMAQAKKVIKAVMNDSDLTTGVNYGLMTWHHNAIVPNRTNSQHRGNVPVQKNGHTRILANLPKVCPTRRSGNISYDNTCSGGTYLGTGMRVAASYFHGGNTPIDPKAKGCQVNALLVISDGEWFGASPLPKTRELAAGCRRPPCATPSRPVVKTWVIGFGLNSRAKRQYTELADAGDDGLMNGTGKPMFADTWQDLQTALSAAIRQIIASKLSYATPALMDDVSGPGFILQPTFDYKKDAQWPGHLHKYQLLQNGDIGAKVWDAGTVLNQTPWNERRLFTALPACNNTFINRGSFQCSALMVALWGSSPPATVAEQEALVYFVAGRDAYDEDTDGLFDDDRHKLADIYHSTPAIVGPPTAPTATSPTNTESYYRHANGYENFRNSSQCGGTCKDRSSIILAGANSGILHAFDVDDGKELWGFVPPSLLPALRGMVHSGPNGTTYNKTVSIFGVDGSPVVKEIYVNSKWKTIAMVGLRSGGRSYMALDITDPNNPQHFFTFAHNARDQEITYWNADGDREDFSYAASTTIKLTVGSVAPQNTQSTFSVGNGIENGQGATGSVAGWDFVTDSLLLQNVAGTFAPTDTLTEMGTVCTGPPSNPTCTSQPTGNTAVVLAANQLPAPPPELDFRKLGEAWSTPLILNVPIAGNQKWVAIIGGGYNTRNNPDYGNVVYVLNLENGGKIIQNGNIFLGDVDASNDIENAVPSPVMAVTPDMTNLATYTGAMVYLVDLEGSAWKINLTDRGTWGASQRLFDAQASFATNNSNGRAVYHEPALAIGSESKLWLYFGTGDQSALQDTKGSQNRLFGIRDLDFPDFDGAHQTFTVASPDCRDVTSSHVACPPLPGQGWYRNLDPNEKVTGRPLVYDRTVYFSYYLPLAINPCSPGKGFLAALNYECGVERQIIEVGGGIPTAPVIRDGKIYIGISNPGTGTGPGGHLPPGWKRSGNIIVGTTPAGFSGALTFESWRELY